MKDFIIYFWMVMIMFSSVVYAFVLWSEFNQGSLALSVLFSPSLLYLTITNKLSFFYFTLGSLTVVFLCVVIDIFRESYQCKSERHWFWSVYFDFLSQIRSLLGKPRIWLIPKVIEESEAQTSRANDLYREIINVLLHTPVSESKKLSFNQQSSQILLNINKALWKQSRSRYLYAAIKHHTSQAHQSKQEIESMIKRLNQEVERSLDVLTTVSVSLLNVELAHGDAEFDRLLNELNESNNRLRELSEAYKDSKTS